MICGLPSPINPSHAPTLRQPVTDNTFILPLIQRKNPPKLDAESLQFPPGSSSLQHQAQGLQAIHETIQQFHKHLKSEQLDRKTLQLLFLQLQNHIAILRYLLFSSVGTLPISDIPVKFLATSPVINTKSHPNPNPNPTSTALLPPCADEPKIRRFTPEGAVGKHRVITGYPANADFQFSPNTREAPPTTAQNFTSRFFKLEKLFADGIATYTSITAGIDSLYFFFSDKTP